MTSISNLAVLLAEDSDKADEAEPLIAEALAARREKLGPRHQATLDSINNMGDFLERNGDVSRAQELYEEALAGYTEVLGSDHAKSQMVQDSLNNLRLDRD